MMLTEQYRHWFGYEEEMHAAVLQSLESVPEARRKDAAYGEALDLLGHVAAARLTWLVRFGVTEDGPASMFPDGCTAGSVEADFARMNSGWRGYLDSLGDADLEGSFEYTANDGKRYRNSVADILTQLHGHSLYHRGQVARIVRQLGGTPAVTDYVYWARDVV